MVNNIVIGSGPAGVAVSKALLSHGQKVTMLDVGHEADNAALSLKKRLGSSDPDSWTNQDQHSIRLQPKEGDLMCPFGSDFMYRDVTAPFENNAAPGWFSLRPSFVKGGLSNGWGASTLPYRDCDIDDWPIGEQDLAPHYKALREFVPVSGAQDGLTNLFPADQPESFSEVESSTQANEILERLARHRERLSNSGLHFGKSRQALGSNCYHCAMCLNGCPYGVIFNAGNTVEDMTAHPNFRYIGGRTIVEFDQQGETVAVSAQVTGQDSVERHTGTRVFIGAGVLPTAQIVLASLGVTNQSVVMKDSQQFFLPSVQRWSNAVDPSTEERVALAQIFLECADEKVSSRTIHSQIYTYNEAYDRDMSGRLGHFAGVLKPFTNAMSRRLIVTQTFLHSDDSACVEIRLADGAQRPKLKLTPQFNDRTSPAILAARKKITIALKTAGLVPVNALSRVGDIGSSFHCGGTFPMRKDPGSLETDALGRICGLSRVHIVDASVFPSIPATTITLSVMANAHRIGHEAATLETP